MKLATSNKKNLQPITGKENAKKNTMGLNDLIKEAKEGKMYNIDNNLQLSNNSQQILNGQKSNLRRQLEPIKKPLVSAN